MRESAAKYRAAHLPTEKYKTALSKRLARLEKAKTYLSDDILAQLPKKHEAADVQAVFKDLEHEINTIKTILAQKK
jgi:hypothetical protein